MKDAAYRRDRNENVRRRGGLERGSDQRRCKMFPDLHKYPYHSLMISKVVISGSLIGSWVKVSLKEYGSEGWMTCKSQVCSLLISPLSGMTTPRWSGGGEEIMRYVP